MPELPEVETVRRSLEPKLLGKEIAEIQVRRRAQVRFPDPETFVLELTGSRFGPIERRGKYLLLSLTTAGGSPQKLVVHLRMTGQLLYDETPGPLGKHDHLSFELVGGSRLRYNDVRTFGGFYLVGPAGEGTPAGLASLGPEPLTDAFEASYLLDKAAGRQVPLKAFLLDQQVVAGLGNIYVDEVLHAAGLLPTRPASSLTPAEAEQVVAETKRILALAIAERGTSMRDYVDAAGQPGGFAALLQVYGRAGEPCGGCGQPLERIRLAGRSTHYCPQCQG